MEIGTLVMWNGNECTVVAIESGNVLVEWIEGEGDSERILSDVTGRQELLAENDWLN